VYNNVNYIYIIAMLIKKYVQRAILYTQVTWNEINRYNVNYIKGYFTVFNRILLTIIKRKGMVNVIL